MSIVIALNHCNLGYVVSVPGIAIGCSIGGLVLIVLIIIVYKRTHRKRVPKTITATSNTSAATPTAATNINFQASHAATSTLITTDIPEKVPLASSSASSTNIIPSGSTVAANNILPSSGVNDTGPETAGLSSGKLKILLVIFNTSILK